MTGDVVDFPGKPIARWRHVCGSVTFYAESDGRLCCTNCGERLIDSGFWQIPEGETRKATPEDAPRVAHFQMDSREQSFEQAMKFYNAQGTRAVLIVQESGAIHAWGRDGEGNAFDPVVAIVIQEEGPTFTWSGDFSEPLRQNWLQHRLWDAFKLITGQGDDDVEPDLPPTG